MKRVFIGLGSNLESPVTQLQQAVERLHQEPGIERLRCSQWYGSTPVGPGEQPDYVNAAAELYTDLEPLALLHILQRIEQEQGRQRLIRWGARTLDLDILLYDDLILDSAELTIPHPRLHERFFVTVPLYELAPELALPNGQTLAQLQPPQDEPSVWPLATQA